MIETVNDLSSIKTSGKLVVYKYSRDLLIPISFNHHVGFS
jgi:hypothetical protein